MSEAATDPKPRRRWYQFHLWHLVLLVTLVAIAGASLKYLVAFRTFRIAKANFYEAIQYDDLPEVRELVQRYPFLLRTQSPMLRVPGDFSVYTFGETPLSVAVMYESRDTFDYLLSLHPDLNSGGGQPVRLLSMR